MASILYTAKRGLVPGHISGQEYQFDLPLQDLDHELFVQKSVQRSLSGREGALRDHGGTIYTLRSIPVSLSAFQNVLEFVRSCDSNEVFQFDPYGTIAVPVAPVNGFLDMESFPLTRFIKTGQGGNNDPFSITLRIKVIEL